MDIQLVNIFSTTVSVLKDRAARGQSRFWLDPQRSGCSGSGSAASEVGLFPIPAQHEFGVLGDVLLHQVLQQRLHDLGEVLQLVVQRDGEQTGHVAAVPLGEALLGLQGVDELPIRTTASAPAAHSRGPTSPEQDPPW